MGNIPQKTRLKQKNVHLHWNRNHGCRGSQAKPSDAVALDWCCMPSMAMLRARWLEFHSSDWADFGGNSMDPCWQVHYWVVVSNMFYFHPYWGKWSILTNIFQMGWNHQLVIHFPPKKANMTGGRNIQKMNFHTYFLTGEIFAEKVMNHIPWKRLPLITTSLAMIF